MFWKKAKKEIKSREYEELSKEIATLKIDVALIQDRLHKAITRKAIKKELKEEPETNKKEQILPM